MRKRRSPPRPESGPTVILNTFIIDKKVGMISYISFIYVALVSVSQLQTSPFGPNGSEARVSMPDKSV